MQTFRLKAGGEAALWLLGGFLAACSVAGFLCIASLAKLETHVSGMPSQIGFSGNWDRRFPAGEPLGVAWDGAMPRGYERIYLHQGGEVIGSLPESPLTRQVRDALAAGQPVEVHVVELDPLDPARGLRVRVSFEADRPHTAQPVAVQTLSARNPML